MNWSGKGDSRLQRFSARVTFLGAFLCISALAAAGSVRIDLRYPGVYRVTGEELAAAGVDIRALHPGTLRLYCGGQVVPVLVSAGDDDSFDAHDFVEFVADAPLSQLLADDARASAVWYLPENKSNVYFLRWGPAIPDDETPAQYRVAPAPRVAAPPTPSADTPQRFWQWLHFETNYLHTFSTLPPDMTDNFFWMEFRSGMKPEETIRTNLPLPGFDASAGQPAQLDVRVVGVTNARGLSPSHKFSFLYDMKPVGEISFDGIAMHTARIAIPPGKVQSTPARFSFQCPDDRVNVVDAILLDWIQARYPSKYDANGAEIYHFNNNLLDDSDSAPDLVVSGLPGASTIFDPVGGRAWNLADDQQSALVANNPRLTTYTAVAPFGRMQVDRIDLLTTRSGVPEIDPGLQALVVYHPRLQQTADAYTRYRREQGWNIQAVSVRSIFDSLNHGFISDVALKEYVRSVREKAPGLSHLVLLGDAYFDYREARSYDDERQLDVLIPIHWVYRPGVKWSGGYQDDNWYGSFKNEYRPGIAVGRIPVNSDAEGMEYLRKIIGHEILRQGASDKGLMISSVEKSFQTYVEEIGNTYGDQMSTVSYLFPQATKATREVAALTHAIGSGVQLLYYVGHGGSMVWRVGPVDFAKQKDLFTPRDVKKLTNRNHYPLVVCASCYTTAFDQPESIGEAFVNQPSGGAIAVVGASWKATVHDSHSFNRELFHYYFSPDVKTLGQASLLAHRKHIPASQKQALFNSFTFLGDPCAAIVRDSHATTAPATATTSSVYAIKGDRVILSGWDGETPGRDSEVIAKLDINDFGDAYIFRERVLLSGQSDLQSKEITIPDDATTVSITGRSRHAGWVFPRIRVNLVTQDNNRHRVFEGYWSSLGMETREWPVPEYARGHKARLEIKLLNPGIVDEERTFYFLRGNLARAKLSAF